MEIDEIKENTSSSASRGGAGNKKRARRRFNLFDLVIIVAAAAVIGAALYAYLPGLVDRAASGTRAVTLVFNVDSVEASSGFAVSQGETVTLDDGTVLGTVASVETSDMPLGYLPDGNGGSTAVTSPDVLRIRVTVDAELTSNGRGYFCSGKRVAAGLTIGLCFRTFSAEASCVSVVPQN